MRRGAAAGWITLVALWALDGTPALAHSIRGHRVGSAGRVVHGLGHHGHHLSRFHAPYYPYVSLHAYAPVWYPWWGPVYPAYGGYAAFGYADTDVSPEEAEVYVDGEYAGIADDYDGFPDYLALDPGRHTLTFRLEGHRSLSRTIKVPRGAVLRLRFSLPRGSGDEAGAGRVAPESVTPEPPTGGPEDPDDEGPAGEAEPGLLELRVSPAAASVYLDGDFYGTGRTLAGLHGPLRTPAGRRRIQIVMPGFAPATREVDLAPGEVVRLSIELQRESGR